MDSQIDINAIKEGQKRMAVVAAFSLASMVVVTHMVTSGYGLLGDVVIGAIAGLALLSVLSIINIAVVARGMF